MNNSKDYQVIQFRFGSTIENAVHKLKAQTQLSCGKFNGTMLYSDIDDVDSAYVKIIGKTKADKANQEWLEKKEQEEQNHKDSIPQLTKEWIEKGSVILAERYHKTWAECVPIRLNDLYKGLELACTLEIVKELNEGRKFSDVKEILDNQGHSGMSYGLVCSMIKSFSDRGTGFVEYAKGTDL